MKENQIFVFEFVSGGGFSQVDIPSSLFCEGYGMLRCIIADFKALNFDISTLLDERIAFLSKYLDSDDISLVSLQDDYIKVFKESIKECEYCFIIAPEFSNILYDLTKIADENNKKILSVGLKGIKLGTSKIKTFNFFKKMKISTPRTFIIPFKHNALDIDFIIKKYHDLKRPIVIKPNDGVGAESIFYFENEGQISEFFQESHEKIDRSRMCILQEFIDGEDMSASLIGYPSNMERQQANPAILSINSQDINIKDANRESEYFGGNTPVVEHEEITTELSEMLEKLNFSGLGGYYGLDFIRNKDKKIHFIEINPRLTTSYIGVRNIIDSNPASLILNSIFYASEPIEINRNRHSTFLRLELKYKGNDRIPQIRDSVIPHLMEEIPELITPPISFDNLEQKYINFSCFIATRETNFDKSSDRIQEITKYLQKMDFDIVKKPT